MQRIDNCLDYIPVGLEGGVWNRVLYGALSFDSGNQASVISGGCAFEYGCSMRPLRETTEETHDTKHALTWSKDRGHQQDWNRKRGKFHLLGSVPIRRYQRMQPLIRHYRL
jgi:hypothetical protein